MCYEIKVSEFTFGFKNLIFVPPEGRIFFCRPKGGEIFLRYFRRPKGENFWGGYGGGYGSKGFWGVDIGQGWI